MPDYISRTVTRRLQRPWLWCCSIYTTLLQHYKALLLDGLENKRAFPPKGCSYAALCKSLPSVSVVTTTIWLTTATLPSTYWPPASPRSPWPLFISPNGPFYLGKMPRMGLMKSEYICNFLLLVYILDVPKICLLFVNPSQDSSFQCQCQFKCV